MLVTLNSRCLRLSYVFSCLNDQYNASFKSQVVILSTVLAFLKSQLLIQFVTTFNTMSVQLYKSPVEQVKALCKQSWIARAVGQCLLNSYFRLYRDTQQQKILWYTGTVSLNLQLSKAVVLCKAQRSQYFFSGIIFVHFVSRDKKDEGNENVSKFPRTDT